MTSSSAIDKAIEYAIQEAVREHLKEATAEITQLKEGIEVWRKEFDSISESRQRAIEARNSMAEQLKDVSNQLQEFATALQLALLA
jgi:uncharacterized coiled-coil DUF342 family protein